MNAERMKEYWRRNVNLIIGLLVLWAAVGLVASIILAKPLFGVHMGKVPLSFWFAQQGSEIIFVCMIFYYSWKMDKLDKEYGVEEVKLSKSTPIIPQDKEVAK
ncbi:MAG: DUF4212 domain-containing protein [Firmicutes bacterium HGW-Firmicutes-14]|nr:MAG: DUF4212 domain-containing protein [Firmicutes bacterium HGW-Firmicutes-14]